MRQQQQEQREAKRLAAHPAADGLMLTDGAAPPQTATVQPQFGAGGVGGSLPGADQPFARAQPGSAAATSAQSQQSPQQQQADQMAAQAHAIAAQQQGQLMMQLQMIGQQQQLVSQQLQQGAGAIANFVGSPYQQQLMATLGSLNQQQQQIIAAMGNAQVMGGMGPMGGMGLGAQMGMAPQMMGVGGMGGMMAGGMMAGGMQGGFSPPNRQQQTWPEMGAAGGGHPPVPPPAGGTRTQDISRDAAYRNMIALQASALEERQQRRHQRHGTQSASLPPASAAAGDGAGGAGSKEDAHRLAREMAPTYSHSTSEDVELGGLVMQVVGGAIRSRLARAATRADKPGSDKDKASGTPDKKKKKSKKGSKDKGGGSDKGRDKDAPPTPSKGGGSTSSAPAPSAADLIDGIIAELLTALAGHDARCSLPIFAQQVSMINQRLGKVTDQGQVEQLFAAAAVGSVVDFADFLRRESTRAYFRMESPLAA